MIDRITANRLIQKCDFSLQRHLAHVAAAMEAMCVAYNKGIDLDRWYIVGLLHDIDWNETINNPSEHCGEKTQNYLKEQGMPEDWVMDIASHCDWRKIPRDTNIRKALAAIDEVSGFCVATALMRPSKMIGIESKSIMKKFKDKQFARNVNRDDMMACNEYFNVTLPELLDKTLLPAYINIAKDWQLT